MQKFRKSRRKAYEALKAYRVYAEVVRMPTTTKVKRRPKEAAFYGCEIYARDSRR